MIGGGNSALEESIYLAGLARSVTIVIRRDVFRAEEHIQNKLKRMQRFMSLRSIFLFKFLV